MSTMAIQRFALCRVTSMEWVIRDRRHAPNDGDGTVACVYQIEDDEVEVMWLRDLPLMSRYKTPDEALADLRRLHTRSRADRPTPIPHYPPVSS